ncbi:hypothetical protein D3C79_640590 [compost metagenome]
MCLPCPIGKLRVGHGWLVELRRQPLPCSSVETYTLAQEGEQVTEDLGVGGTGRLHAEQQPADALDLTKGTEYGVTQLQFHP